MVRTRWSALITNDEVAAFVDYSDGLLRGLAGVDIRNPVEAVREVRRAVRERGCVGVWLVPWLWQLPITDRLSYPIFAEARELFLEGNARRVFGI